MLDISEDSTGNSLGRGLAMKGLTVEKNAHREYAAGGAAGNLHFALPDSVGLQVEGMLDEWLSLNATLNHVKQFSSSAVDGSAVTANALDGDQAVEQVGHTVEKQATSASSAAMVSSAAPENVQDSSKAEDSAVHDPTHHRIHTTVQTLAPHS